MNQKGLNMRNLVATCLTIFVVASGVAVSQPAIADSNRTSYASYKVEKERSKRKKRTKRRNSVSQKMALKKETEDYASWELRTAPVAFLAKWVTLDASYRLSENFSFGPSVILYNSPKGERGGMLAPAYNGYAAGLNGMLYFDSVTRNTWYSSIHAYYEDFSSYRHGSREGEVTEIDGFKGNTAIGYQWRWSKITMLAGGGVEYRNHNENRLRTDINDNTTNTASSASVYLPFLEFKIGIEL